MTDATDLKIRAQMKQVGDALYPKLWDDWKDARETLVVKGKMDEVQFSRYTVIVAIQMAAVLAVDTLMDTEQFEQLCKANFAGALAKAPKFG